MPKLCGAQVRCPYLPHPIYTTALIACSVKVYKIFQRSRAIKRSISYQLPAEHSRITNKEPSQWKEGMANNCDTLAHAFLPLPLPYLGGNTIPRYGNKCSFTLRMLLWIPLTPVGGSACPASPTVLTLESWIGSSPRNTCQRNKKRANTWTHHKMHLFWHMGSVKWTKYCVNWATDT